jgi:hypothetical protein
MSRQIFSHRAKEIVDDDLDVFNNRFLVGSVKATGAYRVRPKHIEKTRMCQVQLPCKYKDKAVTIVVYEEV